MNRRLCVPILMLSLASAAPALAQIDSGNRHAAKLSKLEAPTLGVRPFLPSQCVSSGSAATFVKVCITDNGNVSYFESPAGYVHIDSAEGYAVCSSVDGVSWQANGFDVNVSADGWGAAAISQPGGAGTFPLVVTRQTLDGTFQLKQTFTANWAERGVDIRTALKNLSGATLDVRIMRSADVDISGNVSNTFGITDNAAFAHGVGAISNSLRGMMLAVAPDSATEGWALTIPYASWNPFGAGPQFARGCDAGINAGGFGDSVLGYRKNFWGLKPGQTQTFTLRYRRF